MNKMTAERQNDISKRGDTIYPSRVKSGRGHAIIINNVSFNKRDERHGSDIDVENLTDLLNGLRFTQEVKKNLKAQEIVDFLTTESQDPKLSSVDVLIVAILSHGRRNLVLGTDDVPVKINPQIVKLFSDCRALEGKPKLFFFQACQGGGMTTGEPTWEPSALKKKKKAEDDDMFKSPDTLLAFASCIGYTAFRARKRLNEKDHVLLGSWFIRALVYVLSMDAHKVDVIKMLERVRMIVTNVKIVLKSREHPYIQLPITRSTLNKPCFLMPF